MAPAMLAFMEFVAQQFTGNYIEAREGKLRNELIQESDRFVNAVYRPRLEQLAAAAMSQSGFLRVNPETIQSLPERVRALEQALLHDTK
jgi:hypothetical protein